MFFGGTSTMKLCKHPIVHNQTRRPKRLRHGGPDANESIRPRPLVAIKEGIGVCYAIGPDGYDLNDEPFVGEGCEVRLHIERRSRDRRRVVGASVEGLASEAPI